MDSAPESSLTCCGSEIQVPFPVDEKVVRNVHLGIRVSSEATPYAVLFFFEVRFDASQKSNLSRHKV